jgi:hypothetical protein
MPQEQARSGTLSRALLITAVMGCAVVLTASIALYIVLVKAPADLASATADGINEVFRVTPRVTINQTVVIEQNSPILEVATVSRDVYVDYRWNNAWMGSTKTVELQATFTAKVGFDLTEPFNLDVSRYPLSVEAHLPEPKILSLEMNDFEIVVDEDGWWNRVTEQDRENAVDQVRAIAREKAEGSGVLEEARNSAEERVREMVERNGASVEFRYPWDD